MKKRTKRKLIITGTFWGFLSTAITFFVLGSEYSERLVEFFSYQTNQVAFGTTFGGVILLGIIFLIIRKLTARLRRSKKLQEAQLEKIEKEMEQLNDKDK